MIYVNRKLLLWLVHYRNHTYYSKPLFMYVVCLCVVWPVTSLMVIKYSRFLSIWWERRHRPALESHMFRMIRSACRFLFIFRYCLYLSDVVCLYMMYVASCMFCFPENIVNRYEYYFLVLWWSRWGLLGLSKLATYLGCQKSTG